MPETAPGSKPRRRLNWRRMVLLFGIGYVAVGTVFSAQHYLALRAQAARLEAQIAAVRRETATLDAGLAAMHNPAVLKLMLTGRRPLPDDAVSPPVTFP
jgi:cell division protein FtsB